MNRKLFGLLLILIGFVGCSDKSYRLENTQEVLGASDSLQGSSTAGNFVATAIKEANNLDIVLYPSDLLDMDKFSLVKAGMTEQEIKEVSSMFPSGAKDKFKIGRMSGRNIKAFIQSRFCYHNFFHH